MEKWHAQEWKSTEGTPAISSLVKRLTEDAIELLRLHGCTVTVKAKEVLVQYPEGSIQYELFPRTHEPRYAIVLPDGFELLEMQVINSHYKGLSGYKKQEKGESNA
jgi:hypothetical protein